MYLMYFFGGIPLGQMHQFNLLYKTLEFIYLGRIPQVLHVYLCIKYHTPTSDLISTSHLSIFIWTKN